MRLVKREVVQIGNLSDLLLRLFAHKHLLREARKLANGTIVNQELCGNVVFIFDMDMIFYIVILGYQRPEGIRLCLGHIF